MTALAKLNVQAGVAALKRMPTVIEAMEERDLQVHGLLYELKSGLLQEVDNDESSKEKELRVSSFQLK
jgi:carbonic anhydrase